MKVANRMQILLGLVLVASGAVAASLLASAGDAYAAVATIPGAKKSFVGIPNQGETTTCSKCHMKPVAAGAGGIALSFEPALGANNTYTEKEKYTITATVTDNEEVAIKRRVWGFKTTAVFEGEEAAKGPNVFSAMSGKPITISNKPDGPVMRTYVSHAASDIEAVPKAGDPTKAATSKRWQFKWDAPEKRPGVALKDVTFYFCGMSGNGDDDDDLDKDGNPNPTLFDKTFVGTPLKLKKP